ncbi:MAG TPA: ATP-binding protein [Vicingus sp.]|nr:ATP-binding protein [Vicingus sp.]
MDNVFDKIDKYNFWSSTPKTGYIRLKYLGWLQQFNDNRLVKVLVGQRRVGKSYVLRQYIEQLIVNGVSPLNTLYINTEYLEYDFLTDYKKLNEFIHQYKSHFKLKGKYYLFIDEIQQIVGWEKTINSLSQDFTQDIEIVITGSNSELLSGELSTLLSGRYVQIMVLPFSFSEYCNFLNIELNRASYLNYLQTGGLPELFHLPNEETKRHYIAALRDTVLLRDVIQRHQIKDAALLLDVFSYLVNNVSTLTSITNLVNYYKDKKRKTSFDTIANYIEYIQQTFIIHRCERFDLKGKEILGGNVKYYLNDLSFKNYLYSGYTQGFGYLLENLVYLQLINHGFVTYIGHLRNQEIDFVAQKNGKKIYIQVAFTTENEKTNNREQSSLLAIKDNYEKWIICMDELPFSNKDGIIYIPVWTLDEVLAKW